MKKYELTSFGLTFLLLNWFHLDHFQCRSTISHPIPYKPPDWGIHLAGTFCVDPQRGSHLSHEWELSAALRSSMYPSAWPRFSAFLHPCRRLMWDNESYLSPKIPNTGRKQEYSSALSSTPDLPSVAVPPTQPISRPKHIKGKWKTLLESLFFPQSQSQKEVAVHFLSVMSYMHHVYSRAGQLW